MMGKAKERFRGEIRINGMKKRNRVCELYGENRITHSFQHSTVVTVIVLRFINEMFIYFLIFCGSFF